MTMGSECLRLNRAEALLWESVTRAPAAASLTATAADALELLSGNTRYRGPYLLSADPVRVLIVASFGECVGLAALVHSIGRFETRVAFSAEAALRLAGEFRPHIVLLSMGLPDLASYRLAATLRWRSGRALPRLIAIADDFLGGARNRALAAGFEQYLTLPVQREALQEVLRPRPSRN